MTKTGLLRASRMSVPVPEATLFPGTDVRCHKQLLEPDPRHMEEVVRWLSWQAQESGFGPTLGLG